MVVKEWWSKIDRRGQALEVGGFNNTIFISITDRYAIRNVLKSTGNRDMMVGAYGSTENLVLPVKWKGPLLQKKLIRWLKSEAETYLTHRTKVWSSHINVPFQTVTITHAKKRLGSCNHKKQIRYTWRIMMLPPSLSDYIILHELAHIKIHSHGEAFWKILREWIPDLEERKNLLKQYIIH